MARKIHRATELASPVPAVLTCGLVEENLHNNREMAQTLRRQGYPVTLAEIPDAHNYTGWRDAFDPYLDYIVSRYRQIEQYNCWHEDRTAAGNGPGTPALCSRDASASAGSYAGWSL